MKHTWRCRWVAAVKSNTVVVKMGQHNLKQNVTQLWKPIMRAKFATPLLVIGWIIWCLNCLLSVLCREFESCLVRIKRERSVRFCVQYLSTSTGQNPIFSQEWPTHFGFELSRDCRTQNQNSESELRMFALRTVEMVWYSLPLSYILAPAKTHFFSVCSTFLRDGRQNRLWIKQGSQNSE